MGIFDFWLKKNPITKVVQRTTKIINLPYYISHFIKKIHFSTLTFFLGPLTWNRPVANCFMALCWHCWHCWHEATRDSSRLQNITEEKYHWNIKETVWLVTDSACGNFTSLHNIYICRAFIGVVNNRKSSTFFLSLTNHFIRGSRVRRSAKAGFLLSINDEMENHIASPY